MGIRPILIHPDPRLRKTAAPVGEIDSGIQALIDDMFETMYDAPGVGLAAPQIGALDRIFVMDCAARQDEMDEEAVVSDTDAAAPALRETREKSSEPIAFINPEIVWSSDELTTQEEGCLSIPDQYDDVARPSVVRVRFLDRDGATHEREFTKLAAACVQHEIDHLNGKLFIDYLGPVRRSMITQKMKKLKRARAQKTG